MALEKSRIAISTCLPQSKDDSRSLTVVKSCILHEKPYQNLSVLSLNTYQ